MEKVTRGCLLDSSSQGTRGKRHLLEDGKAVQQVGSARSQRGQEEMKVNVQSPSREG